MYIEKVPNRNSKPAYLIREGKRQGKKVIKKTIANISDWPMDKIEALRKLLKGEQLVTPDELFEIQRSLPHGHVEAVLGAIRTVKLDTLISSQACRERDLILGMIVERLLKPCSKVATTRLFSSSTLGEELNIGDVDEDELYAALDWLHKRQGRIEKKLARRHLSPGESVFYDVTSSTYLGKSCNLAHFGHNRDGRRGKKCIVFGVLCDRLGRPVSTSVYPGNTGDPTTVSDQVKILKDRFELDKVVLVGDRGMLTQTQITTLKQYEGIGWISALRSSSIKKLAEQGTLQLSLFDTQNLAEIQSPHFPGERLIACYNPLLAAERSRKREDLVRATERELDKVVREVKRRTKKLLSKTEIAQKVQRKINHYKVGKLFNMEIDDNHFWYERNEAKIERERSLDGIYIIRTSEPKEEQSAADTVRSYKNLSRVERLYRSLKGINMLVRPFYHRLDDRIRAHIFLCMLASYVEWHMRQALKPLLFDDEELEENRWSRDPVAPAKASESAIRKKRSGKTTDGNRVHSFATLLEELATRTKNMCSIKTKPDSPPFVRITEPTPLQRETLTLLGLFPEP